MSETNKQDIEIDCNACLLWLILMAGFIYIVLNYEPNIPG